MLRNYFKLALKVLLRRKFFTFISLFGTGFTLLVLLLVAAVLDSSLAPGSPETKLDRTLALTRVQLTGPRNQSSSNAGFLLLDRYMRGVPGVETFSICSNPSGAMGFLAGEKVEMQRRFTDAAFWEAFEFEFVEGRPYTSEEDAGAAPVAVISESMRRRFFAEEPAVGQRFEIGGDRFQVVGVVRDVPLVRLQTVADFWVPIGVLTSPELKERLIGDFNGVFVAESRSQMDAIRSEVQSRIEHVEIPDPDRYDKIEGLAATRLEMFARGTVGEDFGEARVGRFLTFIFGGAVLFMALPAINLINVNLSRMFERASEIGVRKAFGATSGQLVGQFIFENIILSAAGGVLGWLGAIMVLEIVNQSGVLPFSHLTVNYRVFFYALGASAVFGILSGGYPAWRMSRLDPVAALKGVVR